MLGKSSLLSTYLLLTFVIGGTHNVIGSIGGPRTNVFGGRAVPFTNAISSIEDGSAEQMSKIQTSRIQKKSRPVAYRNSSV